MSKLLRSGEQGQTLVLVLFLMTSLLGMAGLAIDYGLAAATRRDTQNAADAIALAAVQELADGDPVAVAQDYATRNGFTNGVDGVTVSVVTPYNGDPEQVDPGSDALCAWPRSLGSSCRRAALPAPHQP